MLTSHETADDYEFFYLSLYEICKELNITLNITYLMQDASKAESSALQRKFPNAIICMCYFHVTENIKNNLKMPNYLDVPLKYHEEILNDITHLHYSVSSFEFESRKITILNKWLMEMQLPYFHQYFCNQLING
jgi:hypothetical protein